MGNKDNFEVKIEKSKCFVSKKIVRVIVSDYRWTTLLLNPEEMKILRDRLTVELDKLQTKNLDNLSTRLMRGTDEGGID